MVVIEGRRTERVEARVTNYFVVMTSGFGELEPVMASDIIRRGMAAIKPEPDTSMIVFDPEQTETVIEDGGRTLHVAYPGLETRIYAKLDDYGSPEFLSENVGRKTSTQYMVTFLLAEEY